MAKIQKLNPKGLYFRMVDNKPMYSHMVTVEGPGKLVFISGQVSRDEHGNTVGKGDMRAQIKQVTENMKTALAAAGGGLENLVKSTTFVTDYDEYNKHTDLRMALFGPSLATAATVQVARLALPDYYLEIEAIAVI
ncbi:MAG: RidA family protein [Pseudorhodoplanes sp.]